jgi:hypothetical protein
MAKLLEPELNNFEDDSLESRLFIRKPLTDDAPEPLTQEWFRAHPQWATDRLINLGRFLD